MVLKGALISFLPTFIGATPNVVIFQINPETITHSWNSADPVETEHKAGGDPLAVAGLPSEKFEFTLAMDANDAIADGDLNRTEAVIAEASGVYSRLAALEMLQYPTTVTTPALVGGVSAGIAAAGTALGACKQSTPQSVPRLQVP